MQTKRGTRAISNNKKSVFYGTISIAPLCAPREYSAQPSVDAHPRESGLRTRHSPCCQPHSIYIYLLFCPRGRTLSMLIAFCCETCEDDFDAIQNLLPRARLPENYKRIRGVNLSVIFIVEWT